MVCKKNISISFSPQEVISVHCVQTYFHFYVWLPLPKSIPQAKKARNTSKYKNHEKMGLLLSTAVLSVWNSFNGTQENLPMGRSISKHIKIFSLYYVQTYIFAGYSTNWGFIKFKTKQCKNCSVKEVDIKAVLQQKNNLCLWFLLSWGIFQCQNWLIPFFSLPLVEIEPRELSL